MNFNDGTPNVRWIWAVGQADCDIAIGILHRCFSKLLNALESQYFVVSATRSQELSYSVFIG
jgi:hypothetical protein